MLKITQESVGVLLILIAFFLWFSLVFSGGVGVTFVNYSLFVSALLIFWLGISSITEAPRKVVLLLGTLSIFFYIPVILQRFDFKFGLDSAGLTLDLIIIIFVFIATRYKTDKSKQR